MSSQESSVDDYRSWVLSHRSDVFQIALVSGCLVAWMLFLGFPLIFVDSSRYLSPLARGVVEPIYAPTLPLMVLRPLSFFVGPWALTVWANLLLVVTASCACKVLLGRISALSILATIYFSGMNIIANTTLMDAFMPIGALAIFVLARGRYRMLMIPITLFCMFGHTSGVLTLSMLAFCVLSYRRQWRTLGMLGVGVGVALVAFTAIHSYMFDLKSPFSRYGSSFVVARIMADMPATIEEFSAAKPDSALARRKEVFLSKMEGKHWQTVTAETHCARVNQMAWQEPFPTREWPEEGFSSSEQKEFVLYVVLHHPLRFARIAIGNTAGFFGMSFGRLNSALTMGKGKRHPIDQIVRRSYPEYLEQLQHGIQWNLRDNKSFRLFYPTSLYSIAFALSLVLNLVVLIDSGLVRREWSNSHVVFAVLAILTCVFHSAVMSNLSCCNHRYVPWMFFPSIFAAAMFVASLVREWWATE